eukprot:scaffold31_cov263-Pinguiococcus_pyrenoidosus.AAC.62
MCGLSRLQRFSDGGKAPRPLREASLKRKAAKFDEAFGGNRRKLAGFVWRQHLFEQHVPRAKYSLPKLLSFRLEVLKFKAGATLSARHSAVASLRALHPMCRGVWLSTPVCVVLWALATLAEQPPHGSPLQARRFSPPHWRSPGLLASGTVPTRTGSLANVMRAVRGGSEVAEAPAGLFTEKSWLGKLLLRLKRFLFGSSTEEENLASRQLGKRRRPDQKFCAGEAGKSPVSDSEGAAGICGMQRTLADAKPGSSLTPALTGESTAQLQSERGRQYSGVDRHHHGSEWHSVRRGGVPAEGDVSDGIPHEASQRVLPQAHAEAPPRLHQRRHLPELARKGLAAKLDGKVGFSNATSFSRYADADAHAPSPQFPSLEHLVHAQ